MLKISVNPGNSLKFQANFECGLQIPDPDEYLPKI
jgi:hypothetical protein